VRDREFLEDSDSSAEEEEEEEEEEGGGGGGGGGGETLFDSLQEHFVKEIYFLNG
jgi:hypothetical protein